MIMRDGNFHKDNYSMYVRQSLRGLFYAAIFCTFSGAMGVTPTALAAGTPVDERDVAPDNQFITADREPVPVAIYLSIKEPTKSFVLDPRRTIGQGHVKRLQDFARLHNIEPVWPVITDVLHEALTAVRIGMHDGPGLSQIAMMHGARLILAGRLVHVGYGKWQVSWSLSSMGGARRWRLSNVSYGEALRDSFDKISAVLKGRLQLDPYPPAALGPVNGDVNGDVEKSMAQQERQSLRRELGTVEPRASD